MLQYVQYLTDGLTLGAVYALIAMGYTMVYGVIGMINFAHGDIFMIGAYAAAITAGLCGDMSGGWVFAFSAAAAMCTSTAYALAAERLAYRPLRNAPRISLLIAAVGVSVFLESWVPLLQGTHARRGPSFVSGSWVLAEENGFQLSLGYDRLLIWGCAAGLLLVLTVLVKYTAFGRMQRAVAQDRTAALLLGVPINTVITATFALGAVLAGAAGTLSASYYGVVTFTDGFMPGMKAFSAAVVGGIGSLPGAAAGGLLIGLAEALWAGTLSGNSKDAAAFGVLIVVLSVRPSGLFGRPETEKV